MNQVTRGCWQAQIIIYNQNNLLLQPQSRNKFGARAFSAIAPHLWNKLPEDIKKPTQAFIISY